MEYHSGGSLPLLGRPRYCPGTNANGGYLCETGHCCGETGCCTYYYELWWFWLLWTVLILFSCCCAYRHRRAKLRVQQQQRQRDISLLAYHGARSYPSSMLDLSFLASLKLPSYDEVAAQPSTPPPPYSSVFTTPRYPQPPRAADPHLLTQHGPLLHRPLSDGPSSLSSDNSSSCSCDSCCPSSPCSSSLSAPVTYETDTSHNSTPNEAAPLRRDVTLEMITAAATRLELNEAPSAPETMASTVAIDIGDAAAAGGQETIVADSSDLNQTASVVGVTRATSPQSLPASCSDTALPVETTFSIVQQLDLSPCTPLISICSSGTGASPSIDSTTNTGSCPKDLITTGASKTTAASGTSPPATDIPDGPNSSQSFRPLSPASDTAHEICSPTSIPSPESDQGLPLIPGSVGLSASGSISSVVLVPDSPNHIQTPNPTPTKTTQNLEDPLYRNITQVPDSKPADHNQTTDTFQTHLCQVPEPVPVDFPHALGPFQSSPPQVLRPVVTDVSQAPDPVQTNRIQATEPLQTNHCQILSPVSPYFSDPIATNLTLVLGSSSDVLLVPGLLSSPTTVQAPTHSSLTIVPATPSSSSLAACKDSRLLPQSGLAVVPLSPVSGPSPHPEDVGILSFITGTSPVPGLGPSVVVPQSSQSNLVSQLPSDSQPGVTSGSGLYHGVGSITDPVSSLVASLVPSPTPTSSICPAITVEPDPSLSPQSPLTVLSPSSLTSAPPVLSSPVVSSTSLLGSALLLDPLTALHQSDQGSSSSGHASSLSPSPRATQSPPKQTLFSPCVDVIEPGPPSWEEDGGEDQDEVNHVDDEDEDMGADESQYRHRRLTGDSGIEVCRCRVKEDEEDEAEVEERKEGGRRGVESGGEKDKRGGDIMSYHDSADCPARGQITTEEGLMLCNPTPAPPESDDGEEGVVVMETA